LGTLTLKESEPVKAGLFLPAEGDVHHQPGQRQGMRLPSVKDGFLYFGGQEVKPVDLVDVFALKFFSSGKTADTVNFDTIDIRFPLVGSDQCRNQGGVFIGLYRKDISVNRPMELVVLNCCEKTLKSPRY
jgi:hypothetical protein